MKYADGFSFWSSSAICKQINEPNANERTRQNEFFFGKQVIMVNVEARCFIHDRHTNVRPTMEVVGFSDSTSSNMWENLTIFFLTF